MKINKTSKKAISIILAVLLVVAATVTAFAADGDDLAVNPDAKPSFITTTGGIYAHAQAGSGSTQAWQLWQSYSGGINTESNVRYFFLPATADDNKVELYNNYTESVTVGSVAIAPNEAKIVSYTDGAKMTVSRGSSSYTMVVRKSDSEASVYINDSTNSYVDANGVTQNTDFYSFLIQNKANSVKGSDVSIVSESGVNETTLKKIKGRGNTNWRETDKKPFNITFNDTTTIGHTTGKKFSFVSNAKDSTLIRNSIMYDLAHDVGNPYAPNTSFVDFYVNGVYRGLYIACDKIDLGKNSVVSLKDESDTKDSGFSFLVEVDVWNYQEDVYFVTDRGYHIVLKTPDLEDFQAGTPDYENRLAYIQNTYQNFEDTLYGGTLSELEQICDLDSLATMYMLQDFGKNCDGGYTSTYFTYNAADGKFYAAPIWDCDSDLGAVDCVRDGCSTSTCNTQGWTTRLATYQLSRNSVTTVNPYGKAFTTSGKTADGKTFEDIVKTVWNERFVPAVDVLMGKSQSNGRLKSIDEYASSITKASYNNYIMWSFMWYCSRYSGTGLSGRYSYNYSGELSYLKDWTQARANWITTQYTSSMPTNPTTPSSPSTPQDNYYLTGVGFGGWGATDYQLTPSTDGTYYIDVTFEKDTHYYFKIFDGGNNYYTADFRDAETSTYVHAAGAHDNTEITPTEDTKVRITLRGNAFYVTAQPSDEPTDPTEPEDPDDDKTIIFFKNTHGWSAVNYYVWTGNGYNATVNAQWPGEAAQYVGKDAEGTDIYKAVFDSSYVNIIFNDANQTGAQTADTAITSNKVVYTPNETGTLNNYGSIIYDVSSGAYSDSAAMGDADLNGSVNINDGTAIQLYLVGINSMTDAQKAAADFNKDGKNSIRDVTMIQLYLAGKTTL